MTKRERILELIRIEVAKEGKATHYAMRLYVENRIGREAFDNAVWSGLRLHEDLKRKNVIQSGGGCVCDGRVMCHQHAKGE